jgi:S1-C subfamily serine protease
MRRPNLPPNLPVIVGDVTPGSPAALAGLMVTDTITHINGHPIRHFNDLLYHTGSALAGNKIDLGYKRTGRTHETEVTLAKYKSDFPFIASVRPGAVFGLRVDYASIYSQLQQGPRGNPTPVPDGVLVRELVPDSPAAARFKALGDNTRWTITRVNGTPVATPAEFYKAARGKASVKLTVVDPAELRPREVTLP